MPPVQTWRTRLLLLLIWDLCSSMTVLTACDISC